jgi:hypothetical protein
MEGRRKAGFNKGKRTRRFPGSGCRRGRAVSTLSDHCLVLAWMGNRPCCRSCRHCSPPSGVELGWCQLRRLPIHPELAAELWCHHWTARPPRLPVMGDAPPLQQAADQQLALVELLDPA